MSCDRELLLTEIKRVHQRHHNTEHPFSLLETDTFSAWAARVGTSATKEIDPAFHAFNSSRKQLLTLYPSVKKTLLAVRSRGLKIVAFSDSNYFGVLDRIRRLEIEPLFDHVYCSPRSLEGSRPGTSPYGWSSEKITELPINSKKPNAFVLKGICNKQDVQPSAAIYVGDSLAKDIVMAEQAGVYSVWAKYGSNVDPNLYSSLVKISHWTTEDIEREIKYRKLADAIQPNFICNTDLSELLIAPMMQSSFESRVSSVA